MTDQHGPESDTIGPDGHGPETVTGLRPPARPRWVIWLVIGIALAVLVFLGVHLTMGSHGPMNHMLGMKHALPALGVLNGLDGNAV